MSFLTFSGRVLLLSVLISPSCLFWITSLHISFSLPIFQCPLTFIFQSFSVHSLSSCYYYTYRVYIFQCPLTFIFQSFSVHSLSSCYYYTYRVYIFQCPLTFILHILIKYRYRLCNQLTLIAPDSIDYARLNTNLNSSNKILKQNIRAPKQSYYYSASEQYGDDIDAHLEIYKRIIQ